MTDEKTQLTWHTVWTLGFMMIAFGTLAFQIWSQSEAVSTENEKEFRSMSARVTKLETEVDLSLKHIDAIQYQLDHERSIR